MLRPVFMVLAILCLGGYAQAAPDCYEKAAIPAHEFPFVKQDGAIEVTGLSADGQSCVSVMLFNGEPLVRQKLYAPFRQLYEAYARAIEKGDGKAARKLFAYAAPTPRPFPLWAWLYDEPEGAPMPWGTEMMVKIIRLLAPDKSLADHLIYNDSNNLPVAILEGAWPALFLLMGGELLPSEEWAQSKSSGSDMQRLYSWRYPFLTMDAVQAGKRQYRLRVR